LSQRDLFEREPQASWTNLDELRRRYAALERKVVSGEFSSAEMDEFGLLSAMIVEKEREAREAWAKSFGK